MAYILCFLSGIAFSAFLLLAWSLCKTGAQADELMERINERENHVD
jgi:hypothetical protein